MSYYQQEPDPLEQPQGESKVQKFFGGPGLVYTVIGTTIAVWWAISFFTPEPVHKEFTGSINYSGMAEVLDVGSTPSKCYLQIRREGGRETKQSLPKKDCAKINKGDIIKMENGQYVSTAPIPAIPVR